MVVLRGEDTNWLANTRWSALKTLYKLNKLYLRICIYVHIYASMYVTNINRNKLISQKRTRMGVWEDLKRRKGKEEIKLLY